MRCRYCGRERRFPCANTRDMTDSAISGGDECMAALERVGWGESGERYVRANRAAFDARQPLSTPGSQS